MREEHPSPQQDMWFLPRQPLESIKDCLVYSPRAKLVYELVIIDRKLLSVGRDGALDIPRSHDLFVGLRACNGLDFWSRV